MGTTTYDYDDAGRETHQKDTSGTGTVLSNFTYTYDNADRLTQKTENGTSTTYTYDNASQLTRDGASTFSYDPTGNRTDPGYSTGTGNELTTDGVSTYTHDAAGNVTQSTVGGAGATWVYTYDNRNQMLTAALSATPGGTVTQRVTYGYDAFGVRISRAAWNGTTTTTEHYGIDGWDPAKPAPTGTENFDVWADLDGSNTLTMRRTFTAAFDGLVARQSAAGVVAYYLTDYQGSVRLVVNNSATTVASTTFDASGKIQSGSLSDRFGYTGQPQDAITGLISLGNGRREDNPVTDELYQPDPGGFAASGPNLFTYVGNNPTNATDPSGHKIFIPTNEVQTWKAVIGNQLEFIEADEGYTQVVVRPSARNTEVYGKVAQFLGSTDGLAGPVMRGMSGENVGEAMLHLYGGDISARNPNFNDPDGLIVSRAEGRVNKRAALIQRWPFSAAADAKQLGYDNLRGGQGSPSEPSFTPSIVAGDRDFKPWRWKKVVRGDDLVIVDARGNPQVEVRRLLQDGSVEATVRPARLEPAARLSAYPTGPKGEILPLLTTRSAEVPVHWRGSGPTAEYAVVSIPLDQLAEPGVDPSARLLRMPRPDVFGFQKPTAANLARLPQGLVTDTPFSGFDVRLDLTPGRHALGGHITDAHLSPHLSEITPYISASENPLTPSWGKRWWIDTDAVQESGGKVITHKNLISSVNRELAGSPASDADWFRSQAVEQESLLLGPDRGRGVIPGRGVKSTGAVAVSVVGKGINIVGISLMVDDFGRGLDTSTRSGNHEALGRVAMRQSGALSGMLLGGKVAAIYLGPYSATPIGVVIILGTSFAGGFIGHELGDAAAEGIFKLPEPDSDSGSPFKMSNRSPPHRCDASFKYRVAKNEVSRIAS